jgi:diguanylate cyclase (GGDEF)-like protein
MKEPIRVLVIEDRQSERFIAQQLLSNYDQEFTWQQIDSDSELRRVAQSFNPTLVFTADDLTLNSKAAALDLLQLLSLRNSVMHVVEVDGMRGSDVGESAAQGSATLEWQPISQSPLSPATQVTGADDGPTAALPLTYWRKSLPSLLETSGDWVAMSDSSGWLTYANTTTSHLLSDTGEQSIGTVLGIGYDFAAPGRGPHRLALFDALTGLPNPVHLSDVVGCVAARARGNRTAIPIIALDLLGLRSISESNGCAMGDEVLKVVGSELHAGPVGCGMIARVGEDDILVVLPEPSTAADAAVNVKGNRGSISALDAATVAVAAVMAPAALVPWPATGQVDPVPWAVDDGGAPALWPEDPREGVVPWRVDDQEALLPSPMIARNAPTDVRKEPAVSSVEDKPPARPQLAVEAGLGDAMQRHAIGVHYQPQFELQSGRGCGLEALARWVLASGESVAPTIFIAAAERSGMIQALGAGILRSACETAAAWRGREAERLTVAVNVSAHQINDAFLNVLSGILEVSGLPASRLELEIAEEVLLANSDLTVKCLKRWRKMGVRVAVNHAGTNYSSLGYLSRFPVDRLKLDRSLIHSMAVDGKAIGVIHALIALGVQLGIDVIAEGVETERQFQMLMELGCLQVQGYLLARPMHAVQAQVALRKPWGNLPKSALRFAPPDQKMCAS